LRASVRIGTRGSRLALAQTQIVVERLKAAEKGIDVTVVPLKTRGDVMPPKKLGSVDGKAAFTGEIERQLVAGRIDAAVHSMKDLPTKLDDRLVVAATPRRGDPRDAFVSEPRLQLENLRTGASIGTSSVRRRAQLLRLRQDLEVVELHGNIETRLGKVGPEGLDGVVLAAAGLLRLGLEARVSQLFDVEVMIPAVCQGTIAVECRREDGGARRLLGLIDDWATKASSVCERAFADELGGDCYVPLGAIARESNGGLRAIGMVASTDGGKVARSELRGPSRDPEALGRRLAARVGEAGGKQILRELEA
jgi:hydroxymethylbilane synthase